MPFSLWSSDFKKLYTRLWPKLAITFKLGCIPHSILDSRLPDMLQDSAGTLAATRSFQWQVTSLTY